MNKKRKLIEMIKIELDDFKEDILNLQKINEIKHKKNEITEFVFRCNNTVIQQIITGVGHIQHYLDQVKEANYQSLEALEADLNHHISTFIQQSATPRMAHGFILRKLSKIHAYLNYE